MTKRERWFGIVEAWQRSGIGKQKFAKQENLGYGTLQYWCKQYREAQQPVEATPSFLSLGAPATDPTPQPRHSSHIVIVLPSGVRIEVH